MVEDRTPQVFYLARLRRSATLAAVSGQVMDISFICKKCSQPLTIDETGAGTIVECPKCATSLTVPDKQSENSPAQPPSQASSCPSCGTAIHSDFVICTKCGLDFRTGKKWHEAGGDAATAPVPTVAPTASRDEGQRQEASGERYPKLRLKQPYQKPPVVGSETFAVDSNGNQWSPPAPPKTPAKKAAVIGLWIVLGGFLLIGIRLALNNAGKSGGHPSVQAKQQMTSLGPTMSAAAMCTKGENYYTGQGVPQDYAEAAKWYRKAAEMGNADAMRNLGNLYYDGHGLAQDYAEAVKWIRKAAVLGDPKAMCYLGLCYYAGRGVAQDSGEAMKWYRKAADLGCAEAVDTLKPSNGILDADNMAISIESLFTAAKNGNMNALYALVPVYNEWTRLSGDMPSPDAAKQASSLSQSNQLGYASPTKDLLIDDGRSDGFEPLTWVKTYPLVKELPEGVLILVKSATGEPRIALVPANGIKGYQIRTGINQAEVTLKIIEPKKVTLRGCVPLDIGKRYPIIGKGDTGYLVSASFAGKRTLIDEPQLAGTSPSYSVFSNLVGFAQVAEVTYVSMDDLHREAGFIRAGNKWIFPQNHGLAIAKKDYPERGIVRNRSYPVIDQAESNCVLLVERREVQIPTADLCYLSVTQLQSIRQTMVVGKVIYTAQASSDYETTVPTLQHAIYENPLALNRDKATALLGECQKSLQALVEAQQAKRMVKYQGSWMTEGERNKLIASENATENQRLIANADSNRNAEMEAFIREPGRATIAHSADPDYHLFDQGRQYSGANQYNQRQIFIPPANDAAGVYSTPGQAWNARQNARWQRDGYLDALGEAVSRGGNCAITVPINMYDLPEYVPSSGGWKVPVNSGFSKYDQIGSGSYAPWR